MNKKSNKKSNKIPKIDLDELRLKEGEMEEDETNVKYMPELSLSAEIFFEELQKGNLKHITESLYPKKKPNKKRKIIKYPDILQDL